MKGPGPRSGEKRDDGPIAPVGSKVRNHSFEASVHYRYRAGVDSVC